MPSKQTKIANMDVRKTQHDNNLQIFGGSFLIVLIRIICRATCFYYFAASVMNSLDLFAQIRKLRTLPKRWRCAIFESICPFISWGAYHICQYTYVLLSTRVDLLMRCQSVDNEPSWRSLGKTHSQRCTSTSYLSKQPNLSAEVGRNK